MKSRNAGLICLAVGLVFLAFGCPRLSDAGDMDITVAYDVSLSTDNKSTNQNNPGHQYLFVGANRPGRDFQGMFGFDVSQLTSTLVAGDTLIINSISFNSYMNWNDGDGDVDIALGNIDNWDVDVVTWNSSHDDHGATLDTIYLDDSRLNSYVTWDVTSIGAGALTDNDFVTFYLSIPNPGISGNWHNFENEEWSGTNESFLSIDFDIVSAPVPEPATVALLGIGIVGLAGAEVRRRRKKKAVDHS